MAFLSAVHTAVASSSGGSPTALERKIVASRDGALSSSLTLKTGGASRLPGIFASDLVFVPKVPRAEKIRRGFGGDSAGESLFGHFLTKNDSAGIRR